MEMSIFFRVGEVWIGFARLRMWSWPDGSRWVEGQSTANFIPGKPGLFDKWSYLTADGDLSATADEEQLMYYICEVDKVSGRHIPQTLMSDNEINS